MNIIQLQAIDEFSISTRPVVNGSSLLERSGRLARSG